MKVQTKLKKHWKNYAVEKIYLMHFYSLFLYLFDGNIITANISATFNVIIMAVISQ